MRTVFVDSFYFLAALNDRDAAHAQARQFARAELHMLVTTEWVLMEVADAFARPQWRSSFVKMLEDLRSDANVKIIEASHELFERAAQLYAARPDKDWSLTDCTSFIVMQDHGLQEALTADHHFEQAGFTALLA